MSDTIKPLNPVKELLGAALAKGIVVIWLIIIMAIYVWPLTITLVLAYWLVRN